MAQRDCICETHEAEEIVEEAAEDSTADRRDDRDVCEVQGGSKLKVCFWAFKAGRSQRQMEG